MAFKDDFASFLAWRIKVGRPSWSRLAGESQPTRTFPTTDADIPARIRRLGGNRDRIARGELDEATHRVTVAAGEGPGGSIQPGDVMLVESGPSLVGEYFRVGPTWMPGTAGDRQKAVVELSEEEKQKAERDMPDALT